MGWLKMYEREHLGHHCVLPSPHVVGVGSVYQCDDCGKKYQVVQIIAGAGRRNGDHDWLPLKDAEQNKP